MRHGEIKPCIRAGTKRTVPGFERIIKYDIVKIDEVLKMDLTGKVKPISTSKQSETILTMLTTVFPSPMYQAYPLPTYEFTSHGLNFLTGPAPYPNTPGGAII